MKKLIIISFLFSAWQCAAQNYKVEKAKFNTNYAEYCAGLLKDGVIFSSTRKPEVLKTYMDEDDNYYTNLYVSKEKNGEARNQQELLSKEISSVLNDGSLSFEPGGRTFWYTSNILTEEDKIRSNKEFKLGIFKAAKRDGKWTRVQAFPFNAKNHEYNVAHPAISPDGNSMIFSTDMEGGVGASDLWIVYKTEETWSEPQRLPEGINTPMNELFPYIDKHGRLYFSSNGLDQGTGLDVYSTNLFSPTEYETPERMKAPINTEFDDYAFLMRDDGETGYFSSNRENMNDDVYSFEYSYPDFIGCQENYKPYMCYLIEETNITKIDTLPLAYIWDFGDGTTANGFKNEHCYADTGFYEIKLNIIDTITGVTYATISDMELLIEQPNQPYITSPDTLIMNDDVLFSSAESTFDGFEIEEWFWEMGGAKNLRGAQVNYVFDVPGVYQIKLMALSVPDESGYQSKSCVYKDVLVVENELELDILREAKIIEEVIEEELILVYEEEVLAADQAEESIAEEELIEDELLIGLEDLTEAHPAEESINKEELTLISEDADEELIEQDMTKESILEEELVFSSDEEIIETDQIEESIHEDSASRVLNYEHLEDEVVKADQIEDSISEEVVESTYYVEVAEAEESMALSDPYFDKIKHEITERFQEEDSVYIYSVGQAKEVFALWDIYKEILDSGYVSAIVKQDRIASFESEIEKVGYSAPEDEREAWNRTITDFANIQFDNNSSKVMTESIGSLDYIAAMMSIEEEFNLKIDAYTDNKGNDSYNKTLSDRRAEAVKKYLIRKGIDPKRLISLGHGELDPISSNETELGRAINRRVEFEIQMDLIKLKLE